MKGGSEAIAITIVEADLNQASHQEATLKLVNAYAMDPMGDDKPLAEFSQRNLISGLREHPTTMIFLAYSGSEPVGMALCFRGFSTFAARPLINIHDFYVAPEHRGTGVSRRLMSAVEARARDLGCCKLTLEVQENNHRARGIYAAAGFARSVYVLEAGGAFFLSKPL
jgi:GNAT superfamily N-acetyltransferase